MATDRLLLSMLDMLTKNGLRESDELKCASSNDISWKILRQNDRCLS